MKFTKDFIAGQKRIFDNPELDISVWVTESWSNYYPALDEIERLQAENDRLKSDAAQNELILLELYEH